MFQSRLDRLHYFLDGSFMLLVFAIYILLRPILNHYVRLNTLVLDDPLAVQIITREFRPRDIAAIHQRDIATNAANPTPCALSDERTQLVSLKAGAENVSIRRCIVIGYANH